jgi:hypothetical protein
MADEQGSLFSTSDYEQAPKPPPTPGWGVPHGRPNYPGQAPPPQPFQPTLTAAPPGHQAYPEAHPTQFAASGIGKYYTRNANGRQFNKPAIAGAIKNGINAYDDARYFRQQGFGAAIRHTLGMDQAPSHRSDDINARRHAAQREATMGDNHGVTGANPDPTHVQRQHSAFEPGLSW